MKNDDEMYQSLLSRYEAYQEEKIQRKRIVRRIVPIAACFCLSVALGCSYWFHFRHIPTIPTLPETTEEQTTEQPATHPTETEANADPTETIMTETVILTETAPLPTDPTEPIAATAATIEALHVTEPPTEAEVRTEAAPIATDSPAQITEPAVIPPTEPVTEKPTEAATAVIEQELDGFVVVNYDGRRMIRCTDAFPEPTGELQEYRIEGELVWLLDCWDDVTEDGRPIRYYKIECLGEIFTVTQQEYASFSLEIPDNTSVIEITTNRTHGFRLPDEWECTVYWFEDGEGFCVKGESASKMDRIARSLIPVESAGS